MDTGVGKENALPVIQLANGSSARLSRRECVHRLLVGMSAGTILPLACSSHPIYEHLRNEAILHPAESLGGADWKPVFLSVPQNQTLYGLAEAMVPGSSKAEVNRFIDLLLSVDKPENQGHFVDSLAAFEAESKSRFGKVFSSLDDSQKHALLTDASRIPADPQQVNSERGSGLYAHFKNLKGWISGAYYSSELGMRELGWTGDYVFAKFPGCEHPEGHP